MNDKEKKPGNPWTKSLLIWVGVLFALVLFVQMIDGGSRTRPARRSPYSEFVRQVDEGNVQHGDHGHRQPPAIQRIAGKLDSGEDFHTDRSGRLQHRRPHDPEGRRGPGQGRGAVAASGCTCSTIRCRSC